MQSLDTFVHISEPVKDAAGVAVSQKYRLGTQRLIIAVVHWFRLCYSSTSS